MKVEEAIELEPSLVEESVLLASEASSPATRRQYRRERNAVYEIPETEDRDAAFRDLDARWFQRLGLVRATVREHPLGRSQIRHLRPPVDGDTAHSP